MGSPAPSEDRFAQILNSLGEEACADEVSSLLTKRMDQRLEAAAVIGSFSQGTLEKRPLLMRALGLNALEVGRLDEAEKWIQRARERSEGHAESDCLLDLALISREWTNWEASSELLDRAQACGLSSSQMLRLLNMRAVAALHWEKDYVKAGLLFNEIEKLATEAQDQAAYLTSIINRGLSVERVMGSAEGMKECAALVMRLYGGEIPLEDRPYHDRLLAEAALMTGDTEGAKVVGRLISEAQDGSRPNSLGYGHALLAYWHAQYGDPVEADRHASEAETSCLPFNSSLTIARLARARVAARIGDCAEACRLVEKALAMESSLDRRLEVLFEGAEGQWIAGDLPRSLGWSQEASLLSQTIGTERGLARANALSLAAQFVPREAGAALEALEKLGMGIRMIRTSRGPLAAFLGNCLCFGIRSQLCVKWLTRLGEPFGVVRTRGPLEVWTSASRGRSLEWLRPKAKSLFAYLIYRGGGPVPIDEVLEELWPYAEPLNGRNTLRVMASYARKTIEPFEIEIKHGQIGLTQPAAVSVDLWQLRLPLAAEARRPLAQAFLNEELFSDISEPWIHPARATVFRLATEAVKRSQERSSP